jgi:hypothetical protein
MKKWERGPIYLNMIFSHLIMRGSFFNYYKYFCGNSLHMYCKTYWNPLGVTNWLLCFFKQHVCVNVRRGVLWIFDYLYTLYDKKGQGFFFFPLIFMCDVIIVCGFEIHFLLLEMVKFCLVWSKLLRLHLKQI